MSKIHTAPAGFAEQLAGLQPALTTQAKSIGARTFDPIDFVQTNISTERARVQVLSSLAWYIDITLVNTARSIFYDMFTAIQIVGEKDSYSNFVAMMNEKEHRETTLVEQGFMEGEGIHSLRQLLILRREWHDAYGEMRSDHIMPTVETLLLNEKLQVASPLTKQKLRAMADDDAKGNKAEADEMFALLVEREDALAKARLEDAQKRVPAILGIIHFADSTSPLASADFSNLPMTTRRRLIESVKSSINQATARLATDRKVEVPDFMAARKEAKAAIAMIDEVLAAPMFNDDEPSRQDAARNDAKNAGRTWQGASAQKSEQRKEILAHQH